MYIKFLALCLHIVSILNCHHRHHCHHHRLHHHFYHHGHHLSEHLQPPCRLGMIIDGKSMFRGFKLIDAGHIANKRQNADLNPSLSGLKISLWLRHKV